MHVGGEAPRSTISPLPATSSETAATAATVVMLGSSTWTEMAAELCQKGQLPDIGITARSKYKTEEKKWSGKLDMASILEVLGDEKTKYLNSTVAVQAVRMKTFMSVSYLEVSMFQVIRIVRCRRIILYGLRDEENKEDD